LITPKHSIKEKMRLYEMYSTAALAGYLSINGNLPNDHMMQLVDETAKRMIHFHLIYLQECEAYE
jgi:hypothetical protein